MGDPPKKGSAVQFLRTDRLHKINISWSEVAGKAYIVDRIYPDDKDWEEVGLGQGVIVVTRVSEARHEDIWSVPLEHWADYIKVL